MNIHHIDFTSDAVKKIVLKAILEESPVAFLIIDKNYRIRFINEYFRKLRRLSGSDLVGSICYHLYNHHGPCPHCNAQKALSEGTISQATNKNILLDQSVLFVEDYSAPIATADGQNEYVLEATVNRTNELLLSDNNRDLFLNIIEALVVMLDKKDPYTSSHSYDVTEIALKLGRHTAMREKELHTLRLASLLHDIGKIDIPDAILNKPTALDFDEFALIKKHPVHTMEILDNLVYFEHIRDMAGHHHERWDGDGYPDGLRGEEIPLVSRIIAIADSYDAMTSERSYRPAMTHDNALREIYRNAGRQFDPLLVEMFLILATRDYPSRQSIVARDDEPLQPPHYKTPRLTAVRWLNEPETPDVGGDNERVLEELLPTPGFAKALFATTPAYYTIIDDNFTILFACENIAKKLGMAREDLVGMRCFEVNARGMSCFRVEDNRITCPLIRAFQHGESAFDNVEETLDGEQHYFEVTAVPLSLPDRKGERKRCMLRILMDRTREMRERMALENDSRALVNLLYRFVANIDHSSTREVDAILDECENFSTYLEQMQARMRQMTGTIKQRRETTMVY